MNEMIALSQLDTPSLLLDLDKMDTNIREIDDFSKIHSVQWRPHIKTHKSIQMAKMQLDAGAIGITVAKLSEAEVMVQAGIKDILIALPLSSKTKLAKLASLLPKAHITLAIDSVEQAKMIQHYFEHLSFVIDVWIKINSGLDRCGIEPGPNVVELAKKVSDFSKLNLTGIFTHAGHSYAASSVDEINKIGTYEGEVIADSAQMCEREGIRITHRSVGSTPTYQIAGMQPGITEVRPGNAVFFDAIQVGLGVTNFDRCALTVLASVVSIHENKRIVLDTGSKSLSLDRGAHGNNTVKGFGHMLNHPDLVIERLSEEHGVVIPYSNHELSLADCVQIIPNHACTVVNLFDHYVLHRQGKVVGQWKVDARGRNQ